MEFITSDLHFNHNREFIYNSRGFKSIQEHDEAIIERWNSIILSHDDVWFLGDIGMGGDIDYIARQVHRLNGTIHWIRGNHDTDARWETIGELSNVVKEGWALPHKYNGQRFWLSHFPTMTAPIREKPFYKSLINLCGHCHTDDRFSDWKDYMIYHVDWDAHDRPITLDKVVNDIHIICKPF